MEVFVTQQIGKLKEQIEALKEEIMDLKLKVIQTSEITKTNKSHRPTKNMNEPTGKKTNIKEQEMREMSKLQSPTINKRIEMYIRISEDKENS